MPEQMDIEGGDIGFLIETPGDSVVNAPACVLCGSTDSEVAGTMMLMKRRFLPNESKTYIFTSFCAEWWSPSVTHVIPSSDQQGAARRTLKFLLAILEGRWIVKVDSNLLDAQVYVIRPSGS